MNKLLVSELEIWNTIKCAKWLLLFGTWPTAWNKLSISDLNSTAFLKAVDDNALEINAIDFSLFWSIIDINNHKYWSKFVIRQEVLWWTILWHPKFIPAFTYRDSDSRFEWLHAESLPWCSGLFRRLRHRCPMESIRFFAFCAWPPLHVALGLRRSCNCRQEI